MKWRGRERSDNVEDRRGMSPQMALGGGGGIVAVIVVLIMKFMGAPEGVQQMAGQMAQKAAQNRSAPAEAGDGIQDDHREFISVVLKDTENIWTKLFHEDIEGSPPYTRPKLVIFQGQTQTKCGMGQAAMGPFYCPADKQIYIDPSFFDDLARRHSAPGDFAQAYVIAHEVAHHIQNLLGFNIPVNQARQSGDERRSNQMSVRLELQADYLAGVWAHHAHREYGVLEEGDMQEAIQAANQIGDDTLQAQAGRAVNPDHFTHGRSDQRVKWFKKGLLSGDLAGAQELFQISYSRL